MYRVLIFNLFLFCVLLILVECGLRLAYPDYHYYYRTHPAQPDLSDILAKSDTLWLQPNTDLGWVCQQKTYLQFPTPPVQGIAYHINKEGFRNKFDFDTPTLKDKKRLLLLGDSFMFGIYLPEEQTIASRLQCALGEDYLVYNISVPAWGLDQVYLAYQKYVDLIKPDQVMLAFLDDDLMRSLEILFHGCGIKPCLKLENHQLVPNHDNPHWWEYFCWNNQIGNRLLRIYYLDKAAKLGQFMLEEIIEKEQRNGRKPIIARIPALVDLQNEVPRKVFSMKELTRQYQVPYLQLYEPFLQMKAEQFECLYIPDDGHFTAEGAALFTDYLLQFLP